MNELCTLDKRYQKMVLETSVMKNAVKLLGGKRKERMEEKGEEGGRGGEVDEQRKEGEGMREKTSNELSVVEKIRIIELILTLVKKKEEIPDEEELKEVVLRLEEEGNTHVEEEEEEGDDEVAGGENGEGEGEEKRKEKREWEELSEKAHELVWVMEMMKRMREGREEKRGGVEWMEKKNRREMEMENCRLDIENRGMKEEKDRIEEENKRLKELCPIITTRMKDR